MQPQQTDSMLLKFTVYAICTWNLQNDVIESISTAQRVF